MAYSECLPTRLNPLAERTCFSQVDTDQSGTISLAEFSVWGTRYKLTSDGRSSTGQGGLLDGVAAVWAKFADPDAAHEGGAPASPDIDVGPGARSDVRSLELSLDQFEAVLATVPDEQWRELFEPVPPPTYDRNGKLGPLLSTEDGRRTRFSTAVYAVMVCYPFVFLLFLFHAAAIPHSKVKHQRI